METMTHHLANNRIDQLRREADLERLARRGGSRPHDSGLTRLVRPVTRLFGR